MPVVTYGHGGGDFSTEPPPVLFPYIRAHDSDDQYRYILETLAAMAGFERDNDTGEFVRVRPSQLFLTDILRGPSYTRDAVGLALHGRTIDTETRQHRAAEDQDEELRHLVQSRTVKVRAIEGRADTIKFKRAVVRDPRSPRALKLGAGVGVDAGTGDGPAYANRVIPNVDKIVDYGTKEADLPLLDAWVCLSKHGKHCRVADSARLQERYWLFEEVRPEATVTQDEPKRGPGRPRKEQQAVV